MNHETETSTGVSNQTNLMERLADTIAPIAGAVLLVGIAKLSNDGQERTGPVNSPPSEEQIIFSNDEKVPLFNPRVDRHR